MKERAFLFRKRLSYSQLLFFFSRPAGQSLLHNLLPVKGKQARGEHPWLVLVAACAATKTDLNHHHFLRCDHLQHAGTLVQTRVPCFTNLSCPKQGRQAVCGGHVELSLQHVARVLVQQADNLVRGP
jgi:hypothetical protein